ncbi:MAG: phosphatase PAP2 family protein, partial [Luteimonas sp.]|nr:phosphatase PAP2 family protein [Luteimonas sp.]
MTELDPQHDRLPSLYPALATAAAIAHALASSIVDARQIQMTASTAIVPFRTRLLLVLSLTIVNSILYLCSNAWPLRQPVRLPLNAIDVALGWHAWTIWPYWLLLLLGPAMALCLRERRVLIATARAYALALAANFTIWSIWPTRDSASRLLPDDLDPLTDTAWRLLYALDGPNNCFPSGHVTIPLVIAAGFCAQYPRARYWVWPLLLALLPSVVTTGQHYSWDVLGGAATAAVGLLVAGRQLRRKAS